jgi:hypothetical protein
VASRDRRPLTAAASELGNTASELGNSNRIARLPSVKRTSNHDNYEMSTKMNYYDDSR